MTMTVWFTADTHFGHQRILELSHRLFPSLAVMEQTLLSNWVTRVGADDIVWHLGDITIDSQWKHGLSLLAGLPGRKRLITGNHDACWPGKRDFYRRQRDYFDVFETVTEFARTRIDGIPVLLSHFPYDGDHTDTDRHDQFRLRDHGVPLICGHIHDSWRANISQHGTRMVNVGVGQWEYAPVADHDLADLIRNR
jgi:calcineurin-like phosphoesterase family protein